MSPQERLTVAQYRAMVGLPPKPTDAQPSPRRNKYGVGPRHERQVDGYTFDSVAERRRYQELRALELAAQIYELRVHPCWPLVVNGEPVGEYEADFSYYRPEPGGLTPLVVEDVKGVHTQVYRLKKRLMKALHGIEIEEVNS